MHVGEELGGHCGLQFLARGRSHAPRQPPAGAVLSAWQKPGENLLALGVFGSSVDLLERRGLGRGEATIRVSGLADDRRRIKMAFARIVEYAVVHSVFTMRIAGSGHSG